MRQRTIEKEDKKLDIIKKEIENKKKMPSLLTIKDYKKKDTITRKVPYIWANWVTTVFILILVRNFFFQIPFIFQNNYSFLIICAKKNRCFFSYFLVHLYLIA